MQSRRNGQTIPLVYHVAAKNLLAGLKKVRFVISSGKVLELCMKQMELTCCVLLVIG